MYDNISALAAGNNAQLMVMVSACTAGSIMLSLVAAAHQTVGHGVCILLYLHFPIFHSSKNALGPHADCVKFVIGDARAL